MSCFELVARVKKIYQDRFRGVSDANPASGIKNLKYHSTEQVRATKGSLMEEGGFTRRLTTNSHIG